MTRFTVLALALVSMYCAPASGQTNSLASLGSGNLTIDGGSTTIAYTQSSTNLTLANTIVLGDTLGGIFASPYNWSAFSDTNNFTFGLLMSAPGSSPNNVGFTIEFINGALDAIVNSYQGSVSGLSTIPSFIPVELSLAGTGDLSSIGAIQFTWDGDGTGTVVLESVAVAVVPEPSTWAMLVLGSLVAGGTALRRRLSAVRR